MPLLEKKCFVMWSQIGDTKSAFQLWLVDHLPCRFRGFMGVEVSPSPKAVLSEFINLLNHSLRKTENALEGGQG